MWLRGSKIWSRMCHIFWFSIILSIFSKMFQNIHVLMLAIFVEFSQFSVVSAVFPWKSINAIIPYQITQHSTFQKHPIFERKCISLTNYNDFQLLKFKSQFVEFEWMFISRCVLTVCAAKPGSLWVLDSQLKTEIHSFSESPPSDVSKYHRGPFGQRPQGP